MREKNYRRLQFSEDIKDLTDAEIAWLEKEIESIYNDAECIGTAFEMMFSRPDAVSLLWIHAEHFGYPDFVAKFVQRFLQAHRPHDCWSMTLSATAKHDDRVEYNGGGVFVTAKEIKEINGIAFTAKCMADFRNPPETDATRLLALASLDRIAMHYARAAVGVANGDWHKEMPYSTGAHDKNTAVKLWEAEAGRYFSQAELICQRYGWSVDTSTLYLKFTDEHNKVVRFPNSAHT